MASGNTYFFLLEKTFASPLDAAKQHSSYSSNTEECENADNSCLENSRNSSNNEMQSLKNVSRQI